MNEKRLGAVVQQARRAAGFTQQTLCQKSGLSYSTLAKIERGAIKAPSVFTIQQVATTLGITLDQLLANVSTSQSTPPEKRVSQNGIRFVYFDMNGCLVRAASSAFTRLAEESGAAPDTVETVYWQYNDAVCRGDKTIDELNTALAERLGMRVGRTGERAHELAMLSREMEFARLRGEITMRQTEAAMSIAELDAMGQALREPEQRCEEEGDGDGERPGQLGHLEQPGEHHAGESPYRR